MSNPNNLAPTKDNMRLRITELDAENAKLLKAIKALRAQSVRFISPDAACIVNADEAIAGR